MKNLRYLPFLNGSISASLILVRRDAATDKASLGQ